MHANTFYIYRRCVTDKFVQRFCTVENLKCVKEGRAGLIRGEEHSPIRICLNVYDGGGLCLPECIRQVVGKQGWSDRENPK